MKVQQTEDKYKDDALREPDEYSPKPQVKLCFCFGPTVDPLFQVYFLLALAQIILYAETGAVPALLVDLTRDFNLSFPEQGYLGGIVYSGIAVGAPFTSALVGCFEPRTILIASIFVNALATILFGLTPPNNTIMLITVRFFIGLTQATLSVFCPVWVDRFATKGNQAKWFSLLQITVPLGIMVGYLMGWGANGLQSESEGKECWGDSFACWRLPFIVQGIITIPLCMAFLLIKHEDLDIGHHNADQDENNKCCSDNDSNHHHNNVGCCNFVKQYFRDLYTIITQFYFTSVVIVITTMYFVLVTIQYWATAWMIVGRSYPEDAVMGWFIFCSATGPTIGAIVGGWLIDYLGGYVGSMEQRRFSTGILFFIYTIGTCFGLGATNWIGGGLTWVVICLWVVLFCGGMVVPALTGMYTAAIPTARLKILGSSLMLVTISVFAYFLCPVVAGHLMKSFSKSIPECIGTVPGTCPAALEKGFRWSMNMSPVSLILLLVVWVGGCFLKGDRLVDTVDQRVVKLNNAEDKRVVKLSNNNVEANSSDNLFQLGEDRKVEEEKKNRIEILSKTD